jgi:hypothetical protein
MSISPPAFEVTFSFFSLGLPLFFLFFWSFSFLLKKGQKEVKKEKVSFKRPHSSDEWKGAKKKKATFRGDNPEKRANTTTQA